MILINQKPSLQVSFPAKPRYVANDKDMGSEPEKISLTKFSNLS